MTRILHVSDTHLRAPGATVSGTVAPDLDAAARLRTVLDVVAVAGFVPDLVIHTGDIADDGSQEGTRAAYEILREVTPHVLGVPGNHDRPEVVAEIFGMPRTHLPGRPGWRVVGLDTTIPDTTHGQAAALMDLLDELDDSDGPQGAEGVEGVIVAHHHPLRSRSTHEWFRLVGGEDVLGRIAQRSATAPPLLFLSGHTHEGYDETLSSGVRLLGAPATYYGLAHDGLAMTKVPGTTGARLIEIDEPGVVRTWCVTG